MAGAGGCRGAGTVQGVRALLTPRWIVLHVVLLGVIPFMLWLGWWQWRGGLEGHSPQTTGYAFQWWIFALFALGLWARLVRDELRRDRAGAQPGEADPAAAAQEQDDADAGDEGAGYVRYRAPAPAPAVEDGSVLGRYNDYLAQLSAQDGQSTGDMRE